MLDVIGAGLGRTGTLSLKVALERLGFGPCYHMTEVYAHADHPVAWLRANQGQADWPGIFDGYRATVDWPGCTFWEELLEVSPQAQVILSVRPADRWYESFHATVEPILLDPAPSLLGRFATEVVAQRTFGDLAGLSREDVIAVYQAHNQAVLAGVPTAQLLTYDVSEGWGPLCAFLGVDAPAEPFPNVNDRSQFAAVQRDALRRSPFAAKPSRPPK
jgi:hypothetical protein